MLRNRGGGYVAFGNPHFPSLPAVSCLRRGTFDRLVNASPALDDDESDLGEPMQLVADTGDTSADKRTEVNVDEAVEQDDGGE